MLTGSPACAARTWLGAEHIDAGTFITALAKRKAEYDAVARIDGPVDGGAMPLFAAGDAWQQQVDRGLAIPDDQAYDPSKSTTSGNQADWPMTPTLIIIAIIVAIGIALPTARWRRSRRYLHSSFALRARNLH